MAPVRSATKAVLPLAEMATPNGLSGPESRTVFTALRLGPTATAMVQAGTLTGEAVSDWADAAPTGSTQATASNTSTGARRRTITGCRGGASIVQQWSYLLAECRCLLAELVHRARHEAHLQVVDPHGD